MNMMEMTSSISTMVKPRRHVFFKVFMTKSPAYVLTYSIKRARKAEFPLILSCKNISSLQAKVLIFQGKTAEGKMGGDFKEDLLKLEKKRSLFLRILKTVFIGPFLVLGYVYLKIEDKIVLISYKIICWLLEILKDRTKRAWALFMLSLAILLSVLSFNFLSLPTWSSEKVLKCSNQTCGLKAVKAVRSAYKEKCPACGGQMGRAYKCMVCEYEFSYTPSEIKNESKLSRQEIRKIRVKESKCPNCGSERTYQIGVSFNKEDN